MQLKTRKKLHTLKNNWKHDEKQDYNGLRILKLQEWCKKKTFRFKMWCKNIKT